MKNSFIKIEDLSYVYEEDELNVTPAVKNVSLTIERGEFVAILGHNGSGKSTLAKLLNMILSPSSGRILVDGVELNYDSLTEKEILDIRKKIGMVFQNPDNQLVATIVEDDVAFGPENLGIPSPQIRERVDKALLDVDMLEYAKHEPHRLSGGQKQRIAIAGVIAMCPECIIFDESTAMLDPLGRKEVMDAIIKLNREKGITIILITHYMEEAARADRIVVLSDGEVIADGDPEAVFDQERLLRNCGLAIPQCTELVHRLRDAGISLDGRCVLEADCASLIAEAISGKTNA